MAWNVSSDRILVSAGLAAVTLLSWAYVLTGAGVSMIAPVVWTPVYAVLMFLMWWIMMVAMMLPSAAPMINVFATVNRQQRETGNPFVETGVFVIGYLITWAGFSIIAVVLQWWFERTNLLSPMLVGTSKTFGGILLLTAGLYQLTPIKQACLRHCRSPASFVSENWRPGNRGALQMGLLHGTYCVGCCWFLMGLLFFGGVMNLFWIAGLALFVLFEKLVPAGHWISYAAGVALLAWGIATLTLA
jgi:predicted metal-binding membrane protein